MVQIEEEDPTKKAKKHFAEMLYHECVKMDENNWDEFQKQCFQILMHFKEQARTHKQELEAQKAQEAKEAKEAQKAQEQNQT